MNESMLRNLNVKYLKIIIILERLMWINYLCKLRNELESIVNLATK